MGQTNQRRKKMSKTIKSWAIVVEWENNEGKWNTETITDIDNTTASAVDAFLTDYETMENTNV
jgi:hypothetical protein